VIIRTSFYLDIYFEKLQFETFFLNISNTRDSVSSGYPNTEKGVENTTRSVIRGNWIADETLSRVFIMPSQSKRKLR